MQEEMMMKLVYSAAIVGGVALVTSVVVAAVMLVWAYCDGLVEFERKRAGKYRNWRLRIGSFKVRWISGQLVITTAAGKGYWFDIEGKFRALRKFWKGLRDQVREYSFRITPWTVYFWHIERDCDHCWVEQPLSYPNGWVAWADMNSRFEDAEGPCTFTRITRREYLDSKASWRDAAAEAAGY